MVTLTDVAACADVAVSTVSKYFNGGSVRESSRKNWLPHWKYLGRLSARWKTDDIILRLYWRLSLHGILI